MGKSVWQENPDLGKTLQNLINNGVFKSNGYEGLLEAMQESTGVDISMNSLRSKVGFLVWQNGENASRNRRSLTPLKTRAHVTNEEIERSFPNLPVDFVKSRLSRKSRNMDEDVPERARLLIGDPSELEKSLDLPAANMEKPFIIEVEDPDHVELGIMNAIQIGLIYPEDIERNVARNKVKMAEAKGVDVILVTDNILHMDTKKASKNKPIRAQLSGMHVKPDILAENEWAYDSEEEIRQFLSNDDVIFVPMETRFKTLLDGLKKIFHEDDEETPIFSGKVIVQLGLNENEIASYAARDELRARVQVVENHISNQIRELKQELDRVDDPVEEQAIEDQIDVLAKRKKIATMTYSNDEFLQGKWETIHAWMIEHIEGNPENDIEASIPNSKVIGIGNVVFQLGEGGPVVESRTVGNTRTSDTAHDYAMEDANRRSNEGALPDAILVNGSTAVCEHVSWVRTMSIDGEEQYTPVIQTPVLLDRDFLKRQAENLVQGNEPIQRLLRNESLYTGSIDIGFHVLDKEVLNAFWHTDSRVLADPSNFTEDSLALIEDPEAPTMIYSARQGDAHEGNANNVLYECDDSPLGVLRHDESFIRMLNRMNAPIAMFSNMGDTLQGRHFENQNPPHHPDYMRQQEWREWLEEALKRGVDSQEIAKEALVQAIRRKEVRPQDQMENYLDRWIRNTDFLDFLVRIIQRAEEHGIFTAGEISLISFLPGNHMSKTWDKEYLETIPVVRELINRLEIHCAKNDIDLTREIIENHIQGLNIGEHGAGYGALGIMRRGSDSKNDCLLYSFGLRHDQEKGASKYRGTTRKAARDRDRRGSHKAYMQGLLSIDLRGDAHMGGGTRTNFGFYLATGCQTDGGPFGEWLAYSLPHVSSDILGMPVDGPESGSFVTISVTKPVMQEWLKNPDALDPKKIFRNALGWCDN